MAEAEEASVIVDVEAFVEGVLQEEEVVHPEVVVALGGAEGDFRTFCNFSSALLLLCCQLRICIGIYYNRVVFMFFFPQWSDSFSQPL